MCCSDWESQARGNTEERTGQEAEAHRETWRVMRREGEAAATAGGGGGAR